jgi:hypothetical protein
MLLLSRAALSAQLLLQDSVLALLKGLWAWSAFVPAEVVRINAAGDTAIGLPAGRPVVVEM